MRQRKWGKQATRRQFVGTAAAFAAWSIVPRHAVAGSGQLAPSDKMNLGCVGVGGMQGAADVDPPSGLHREAQAGPLKAGIEPWTAGVGVWSMRLKRP